MSESPPTAPTCYRHTSKETWVRCTRCERPICPDCMREASVGFQCPECVAEGRRTQRPARTAFGGSAAGQHGYVTKAIIAINVAFAALGLAIAGAATLIPTRGLFSDATKYQVLFGVIGPTYDYSPLGVQGVYTGVYDGGYYRLLTAMFVHYGIVHLAFNMYVLWTLGRVIEATLGPIRFAALYLLAGIGGNVAALLLSPGSLSAGASTAGFGLFAAYFVIARRFKRDTSQIVILLVINLVITFTLPGISWAGHLGGLVTGGLVAAALAYAPQKNRALIQGAGCAAVLVVLLVLTLLSPHIQF